MDDTISQKQCSRCEDFKPLDEFYPKPNHTYSAWCRPCNAAHNRDRYHALHPEAKQRIQTDPRQRISGPIKKCTQCQKYRQTKSFPDLNNPICRYCIQSLRDRAQRQKSYRHGYQLTLEEYDAMYIEQFGLCAICDKAPKDGKLLHVDHCHKTNKVRGLLCMNCNLLLGNARDNIKTLKGAIKYLSKYT